MSEYTPHPDAGRFAELAQHVEAESERQRRRVDDAPAELIKQILLDREEPTLARGNALLVLLQRRDPEMPDILLRLFDDPYQDLWLAAIRSYCPDDPRIIGRLRALLDDPRERVWCEAAGALARRQDQAILPRLLVWLERGDEPHRNVAIEYLLQLQQPEALRFLIDAWEAGGRDANDRVVLAITLLRWGDPRGLPYLEETARRADGAWSVAAATWIWNSRPSPGLVLMRRILDHGTLEAQRAMVSQVWNFSHSPHAFTADGLHDARSWVEQQQRELGTAVRP
jgi:hypothetical protein